MIRNKNTQMWVPLLAPPMLFVLIAFILPTKVGQQLEDMTVDWRFQLRAASDEPFDSRIVLAGIGEYSLEQIGRWEDWNRSIHADFCQVLVAAPPAVVAYDLFYSEASRDPIHDQNFGDFLSIHPGSITGAVVDSNIPKDPNSSFDTIGKTQPLKNVSGDLSALLSGTSGHIPITDIAISSWSGFVNAPASSTAGMRRTLPMVVNLDGQIYPSFVLQILIQLESASPDDVQVELGNQITVPRANGAGAWKIPIDQEGRLLINYRNTNQLEKNDYIKLGEFLKYHWQSGEPWKKEYPQIENNILLIGQMALGLTDFGPTPYFPEEPNVVIHANALNNILQSDFLQIVPIWPTMICWLLIGWATLWLVRDKAIWIAFTVPILLMAAYFAAGISLFSIASLQIPMFFPLSGFFAIHSTALIDRLSREVQEKREIRTLFGAYAGKELVEQIILSGEKPKLGGEKSNISVFFSDVASFSSFSEQMPPEQLVKLMISYMSEMTDILMDHGGVLDKYVGDSIVGMFGVLVPVENHAYRAIRTALEVQRRQYQLHEEWRQEGGWPEAVYTMQTRIGINTGEAVIGNMGSRQRFNYTMMGDTVNIAARCESGAKSYGVYIMVTEDSMLDAKNTKDDIIYRYLDRIVVKGRVQPVGVYEVLGVAGDVPPNVRKCLDLYEEGMNFYLARNFSDAFSLFEKSAVIEPWQPKVHEGITTNPSLVMQERCQFFQKTPPPDDWAGEFVMTTK